MLDLTTHQKSAASTVSWESLPRVAATSAACIGENDLNLLGTKAEALDVVGNKATVALEAQLNFKCRRSSTHVGHQI